ncbi:MAG: methyltransferase domain-containing protein [Deltaproteobacteria bacterium]|nr:methyltransferase domain-containing protein [Deltaproteobacteria bacterium]
MKILEKRPECYDARIGSHARSIKEEIVKKYVRPGMSMLDIGCGTGALLEMATRVGAHASGIDIAGNMLAAARKRMEEHSLGDTVILHHTPAGVVEMDGLFQDKSFDLVTSILVISELYEDELRWMLREIRRILKPDGMLVLAGEVQPVGLVKRVVYSTLRMPMAFVTHLFSRTGTKPVENLAGKLIDSGFEVCHEKRSFLGSFTTMVARVSDNLSNDQVDTIPPRNPQDDFSFIKSVWDYAGRWFSNPVEPGLRLIGSPDENSPVVVTSNYHLTLRLLEKSLAGESCYLLVAPANGINVWCAACGGELTTHSLIRVIKTSDIGRRVDHKRLVLPQLIAPGVDGTLLKEETGWKVVFGPVYARDLSAFLKNNCRKTPEQCIARFGLKFRLEMLFSMNFVVWALIALITAFIRPKRLLTVSGVYWGSGATLYTGYPFIPGRNGLAKAFFVSLLECVAIISASKGPYRNSHRSSLGWMAGATLMNMWFGFDLQGIASGYSSDPAAWFSTLGVRSLGRFSFAARKTLTRNNLKCNNCRICMGVCPKAVFALANNGEDVLLEKIEECFACGACIMQCPQDALSLV